jgi:hypothetical protein
VIYLSIWPQNYYIFEFFQLNMLRREGYLPTGGQKVTGKCPPANQLASSPACQLAGLLACQLRLNQPNLLNIITFGWLY